MIKGLLHNAFSNQIGINQTMAVADLLAAAVPSLYATADPALVDVGLELQDLAVSIPEALKISRLSASDALDIPVNRLPGTAGPGKLLFFRNEVQSFKVGSMKFTIVGPTDQELTDLKNGWVTWLQTMKEDVRRIRRELRRRIEEFSNGVSGDSPFSRLARLERHPRLQGCDTAQRGVADVHGRRGHGRQPEAAAAHR